MQANVLKWLLKLRKNITKWMRNLTIQKHLQNKSDWKKPKAELFNSDNPSALPVFKYKTEYRLNSFEINEENIYLNIKKF